MRELFLRLKWKYTWPYFHWAYKEKKMYLVVSCARCNARKKYFSQKTVYLSLLELEKRLEEAAQEKNKHSVRFHFTDQEKSKYVPRNCAIYIDKQYSNYILQWQHSEADLRSGKHILHFDKLFNRGSEATVSHVASIGNIKNESATVLYFFCYSRKTNFLGIYETIILNLSLYTVLLYIMRHYNL